MEILEIVERTAAGGITDGISFTFSYDVVQESFKNTWWNLRPDASGPQGLEFNEITVSSFLPLKSVLNKISLTFRAMFLYLITDGQTPENHERSVIMMMMTSILVAGKEQMGSTGREMSHRLQI